MIRLVDWARMTERGETKLYAERCSLTHGFKKRYRLRRIDSCASCAAATIRSFHSWNADIVPSSSPVLQEPRVIPSASAAPRHSASGNWRRREDAALSVGGGLRRYGACAKHHHMAPHNTRLINKCKGSNGVQKNYSLYLYVIFKPLIILFLLYSLHSFK